MFHDTHMTSIPPPSSMHDLDRFFVLKNPISNVGQGMNSVKEAFDEVNSYAERYFWPMKVQIFQMIKIAFNSHVFNR